MDALPKEAVKFYSLITLLPAHSISHFNFILFIERGGRTWKFLGVSHIDKKKRVFEKKLFLFYAFK